MIFEFLILKVSIFTIIKEKEKHQCTSGFWSMQSVLIAAKMNVMHTKPPHYKY